MKNIYEEIAKQQGVSPEEVKCEIEEALTLAKTLDLPQSRDFWQNAPKNADELIILLAKMAVSEQLFS